MELGLDEARGGMMVMVGGGCSCLPAKLMGMIENLVSGFMKAEKRRRER